MNKSILIVMCDFLLLSFLSLATFENNSVKEPDPVVESQTFADSQLVDLLKMSLDKEREQRTDLSDKVEKYAQTAESIRQQSEEQKRILQERESQVKDLEQSKAALKSEMDSIQSKSVDLEQKVKASEEKNLALQSEILKTVDSLKQTSTERESLEQELSHMKQSDSTLKSRLEVVQDELKSNKEYLDKLKVESDRLKNENHAMELEKKTLATQLEVAAVKTQIYEENLKKAETLVLQEKTEKEQIQKHAEALAVGVGDLAVTQEKISKDVQQLRPLTASEIFEKVKFNALDIQIEYDRQGIFGINKYADNHKSVLIRSNGEYWVAMNSSLTVLDGEPKNFVPPQGLNVKVSFKENSFKASSIFSLKEDPRILLVKVPNEFAEKNLAETFEKSQDPFRFQDSIIIEPRRFYYGQVSFQINRTSPVHADIDSSLFAVLLGEFSPSSGDLVFSRSGDMIGIMASSSKAVLFRTFTTKDELQLGPNYSRDSAMKFQKTLR